MKKIIRANTFETNSSSSHSLVVGKRTERTLECFPRNSSAVYKLMEYGVTWCDECSPEVARMYSEVDKARFMLNIIAGHIEEDENYDGGHYPEVTYWIGNWKDDIKNPNRTFENLIAQKPFVWLKEVLEEKTGTKIEFAKPKEDSWTYSQLYVEEPLDKVVNIDWFNEEKFKERVAEIIFNEEIVIVDADIPYSCDIDLEDYI